MKEVKLMVSDELAAVLALEVAEEHRAGADGPLFVFTQDVVNQLVSERPTLSESQLNVEIDGEVLNVKLLSRRKKLLYRPPLR